MRRLPSVSVLLVLAGCGGRPALATTPTHAAAPLVPIADPCAGVAPLPVDFQLTCVAAGADAWLVEVEDVAEVDCDDCYEDVRATDGSFRLVYRRADGSRAVGELQPFHFGEPNGVAIRALAVHDFDGDGNAELVVAVMTSVHEGGTGYTDVLTAVGDHLERYAPADAFAGSIDAVRDADDDGRPDIVAYAPWSRGSFGSSEEGGGWTAGPRTLFHALPDGTFTSDGELGRAVWQEDCGANDVLLPPLADPDDSDTYEHMDDALRNVTCAVLLGGATDVVRTRLAREWAERPCTFDEELCGDLHDALEARIEAAARP